MDRAIRLVTASREDLREGIARQRRTIDLLTATVVRLEARGAQPQATISAQQALSTDLAQRVADLERQPGPGPGSGTPKSFPGHQPQQAASPHRSRASLPANAARSRTRWWCLRGSSVRTATRRCGGAGSRGDGR